MSIPFKSKGQDLEYLWIELLGKNKSSKLLMGVVYRSDIILRFSDRLEQFDKGSHM